MIITGYSDGDGNLWLEFSSDSQGASGEFSIRLKLSDYQYFRGSQLVGSGKVELGAANMIIEDIARITGSISFPFSVSS